MKKIDLMIQDVNYTYELYARKLGINNTAMYIFYMIYSNKEISQKEICEFTRIPKQTVNTIVKDYQRKGYIEAMASTTDRRQKTLHLTEKGFDFCRQLLPPVMEAERLAFEHFPAEKQKLLLELFDEYNKVFQEKMMRAMEVVES